jgi:hypothetical protein
MASVCLRGPGHPFEGRGGRGIAGWLPAGAEPGVGLGGGRCSKMVGTYSAQPRCTVQHLIGRPELVKAWTTPGRPG